LNRTESGTGWIEVISGGMFSGKSEELVRRVRRALIARQKTQVFTPATDVRHAQNRVITRDEREIGAVSVKDSAELRDRLDLGVEVVGIDEAQFFDDGIRVIVAGLDQDFARRPFGPMPRLLAVAELVDKMHAVCVRCGAPAHYSQRIAGGSSLIQVGDADAYEARCRRCYEPYEG
jgi:thymidine kinase